MKNRRAFPQMVFLMFILCLQTLVSLGQDTGTGPEMTTEATPTNPDEDSTGTCESKPSPITINTCGGCVSPTSGTGTNNGDVSALEKQVEDLQEKVSELEGYMNILLRNGVNCGGGTDSSGGGVFPPIVGQRFTDCEDIKKNGTTENGVYDIWPEGAPYPFRALCEFRNDGYAYTVIQKRINDNVKFQRSWNEYKRGFGNLDTNGNFWLGLDSIHHLTTQAQYRLRVDLSDFGFNDLTIEYGAFIVGPESDRYRLKIFFYDEMKNPNHDAFGSYHNFLPFSTFDNDNDYAVQNCAYEHSGGWWYRDCDNVNLNGQYSNDPNLDGQRENGIEWDTWRLRYSLRRASMSLRRNFVPNVNFRDP